MRREVLLNDQWGNPILRSRIVTTDPSWIFAYAAKATRPAYVECRRCETKADFPATVDNLAFVDDFVSKHETCSAAPAVPTESATE